MFARDDETAHLLRESTRHKNGGDFDAALACLAQARELMLVSEVTYPIDTWCRAAKFMMKAGRHEEALADLQWLLDDLPRRRAREHFVDDPRAGRTRTQKLRDAKASMKYPTEFIKELMAKARSCL